MTEEEIAAAAAAAQAETEAAAAAAAALAAKATEGTTDAPTAEEVEELRAQLATAQAAAAAFKGIDPKVARENAKKLEEADQARVQAEKDKATAEGNFEKLREIQNTEAEARVTAAEARAEAAEKAANEADERLQRARVKTAFATSEFIVKETILDGTMATKLYDDHVDVVDGILVVFDAPRDASKRTKLMDGKGNPLPFDQAIQKVIEKAPNKDSLMKSKALPGAGSKTVDNKTDETATTDRMSKLSKGFAKLRGG